MNRKRFLPEKLLANMLLAAPLLVATSGCNMAGSSGPSLEMMAEAPAPAASVTRATPPRAADVENALARLPEAAGAVKTVTERAYPNGSSQDIALESDAPNGLSHIAVAIQTGRKLASNEKVPVWKPGEAGVKQELDHEFPNMEMRVVVNGGYENSYGRFGVAIGRDGDALRCIYAWQYVEDARRAFGHGQRIQLAGAEAAPAVIRVKLCRADSTVDQLVADVKALVIDIPETYASAPPVVTPRASPVALSVPAARAPRYHAPRAEPPRHTARRKARPEPPDAPVAQPAYAAPVQPEPVYAAAPPAYAAAPEGYASPYGARVQPPGAAGGPRYLAPVPGGMAGGAVVSASGLNPSLPPQAYRGPGAMRPPGDSNAPAKPTPYRRDNVSSVPSPQSSAEGAPRITPLAITQ